MHIKKIFIFITIFLVLIVITGCGLDKESKATKKVYEKDAKPLAIKYIQEKYNITPKVIKSEAEVERISFGPLQLTGNVIVTMLYKNKKFYVNMDMLGGLDSRTGDTYQNQEIKEDCLEELEKIFGTKPIYFNSRLEEKTNYMLLYHSDYYTKKDLNKFFPRFQADYINAKSVSEEELQKLPSEENFEVYNYKSKKAYKKAQDKEPQTYSGNYKIIYLKDFYTKSSIVEKYDINIKESDIVFVVEDTINKEFYSIDKLKKGSISKDKLDEAMYHVKTDSFDILKTVDITNQELSYVYIKKDKYKNPEELIGIMYCEKNGSGSTSISDFEKIGDYYYTHHVVSHCEKANYLITRKKEKNNNRS